MDEFFLFYRGRSSGLPPRLWPSAFGRVSGWFRRGSGGSSQIPVWTWSFNVIVLVCRGFCSSSSAPSLFLGPQVGDRFLQLGGEVFGGLDFFSFYLFRGLFRSIGWEFWRIFLLVELVKAKSPPFSWEFELILLILPSLRNLPRFPPRQGVYCRN